ncbi:MAG: glycosyltransferase family 2 protein [Cyclobacteriaceae bacterium]
MTALVSIITPVYNAEKYIKSAIQSVISQTYQQWELIIINDGSSDGSKEAILSFSDRRIRYFEQVNKGVSIARNLALSKIRGAYFCFLDADDVMPANSLLSRLEVFLSSSEIDFVDGQVDTYDAQMLDIKKSWKPKFRGTPFSELTRLKDNCFYGITWMIRRKEGVDYQFDMDMNFGEDLWFFITLSLRSSSYDYVSECTYKRRGLKDSLSNSFDNYGKGYWNLFDKICGLERIKNRFKIKLFVRIKWLIMKSYLKRFAFKHLLKELIGIK